MRRYLIFENLTLCKKRTIAYCKIDQLCTIVNTLFGNGWINPDTIGKILQ